MLRLGLAILLSASMATPAGDPPVVASDAHAQRAGELFEAGNYVEAAGEFARAFESTEQAVFLFAQAQALRRAGDCGGAIEALLRYVASSPAEADAAEAERIIEACEDVLGTKVAPPPPTATPPAPHSSVQHRARPVAADPWGASLVAVGGGTGVAGAVLLATGYRAARPMLMPEADYEAREERVQRLSTAGTVLVSVGIGLLIAGVARYAVVARRRKRLRNLEARAGAAARGSVQW